MRINLGTESLHIYIYIYICMYVCMCVTIYLGRVNLETYLVAYPISQFIVSSRYFLLITYYIDPLLFINHLQSYKSVSCEIRCENKCVHG